MASAAINGLSLKQLLELWHANSWILSQSQMYIKNIMDKLKIMSPTSIPKDIYFQVIVAICTSGSKAYGAVELWQSILTCPNIPESYLNELKVIGNNTNSIVTLLIKYNRIDLLTRVLAIPYPRLRLNYDGHDPNHSPRQQSRDYTQPCNDALVEAIKFNYVEAVAALLKRPDLYFGPDTNFYRNLTPIKIAILNDRPDIFKLLLTDSRTNFGLEPSNPALAPPLHFLLGSRLLYHSITMLELLVEAADAGRFDINLVDYMGNAALHIIFHYARIGAPNFDPQRVDALKTLLSAKNLHINTHSKMLTQGIKDGYPSDVTPLMSACYYGFGNDILDLLLEFPNIDVNARDSNGATAFMYLVASLPFRSGDSVPVLNNFIAKATHAEYWHRDSDADNILHIAIEKKIAPEIFAVLLTLPGIAEHINDRNAAGLTPLAIVTKTFVSGPRLPHYQNWQQQIFALLLAAPGIRVAEGLNREIALRHAAHYSGAVFTPSVGESVYSLLNPHSETAVTLRKRLGLVSPIGRPIYWHPVLHQMLGSTWRNAVMTFLLSCGRYQIRLPDDMIMMILAFLDTAREFPALAPP